jgi:hypothetical protein
MRSLAKDAPDASLLNPQSRSNPAQCGSMLIAPSPSPVVVTFKAAAVPRSSCVTPSGRWQARSSSGWPNGDAGTAAAVNDSGWRRKTADPLSPQILKLYYYPH